MTTIETSIRFGSHIRAASTGPSGNFRGVAYTGDRLSVAGYRNLVIDLDGLEIHNPIGLASDHSGELADRVGTCEASVVNHRLYVGGHLIEGTEQSDQARRLLADGGLHLSVGVDPLRIEHVPEGVSVRVNGRDFVGPIDVARRGVLKEISAVGVPADSGAVAIAAAYKGNDMVTESNTLDPIRAERERVGQILAAFEGIDGGETTARELIEAGADVAEARGRALSMIRASRPTVSANPPRDGGPDARAVSIAAILATAGRSHIAAKTLGAKAAEEGERIARREGGSLVGVTRQIHRLNGRAEPDAEGILASWSGTSTLNLPSLGTEAINLVVGEAMRASEATWRRICKRVPLQNFQEHSLYSVAAESDLALTPVGVQGEIKSASLGERTAALTIDQYSVLLGVDRKMLVNGEAAGVFGDLPEAFVDAANQKADDLLLAEILGTAGDAFFTTGRGNRLTGASTNMGQAGVSAGMAALRTMTTADGRVLNLAPAFVVCAANIEGATRQTFNSLTVGRDDAEGDANPWANIAEIVVDARLTDNYWMLVAPTRIGALCIGLLGGNERPTVEEVEMPANRLGKGWRCVFDFGVSLNEWRGAVLSEGA